MATDAVAPLSVRPEPEPGVLRPDPAALAAFWDVFALDGTTYEVRCPHARRGPLRWYGTAAGYFTDRGPFVEQVAWITGADAPGAYITLNPVKPELRARANNRLVAGMKATTADGQIIARHRLLFDFDPVRAADIPATEAEVGAALQARAACEAFLSDLGWPAPLYRLMTGNGGALVYAIDLPNDDTATTLVRACLAAAAEGFQTDTVSIDQTVTNAAPITRIPGTINAKGESVPEMGRVWRRVMAEYPADAATVTPEHLEALAALAPSTTAEPAVSRRESTGRRAWQVADKLAAAGVGFETRERGWGTLYRLDRCLTNTAHSDGAAILELANGALAYRCHHNHCQDKRWADARVMLGLDTRPTGITDLSASKGAKDAEGCQPENVGTLGASWHPSAGLVRLADVKPERVRWLWRGRVPLGKLTIVDGDPGLGKSVVTLDLAARLSRYALMPDGTSSELDGPAGVALLSAEDGLGDTIRPRLAAAGADVSRIVALTFVEERPASNGDPGATPARRLPTLADLAALREAIATVDAKLVVVDPLMAYLPGTTNAHRDQDVRQILAQLAALADETGVALMVVRHLNKGASGNPLYRGGGSIGIIGAARSGLLVAPDPADETETRRILVPTKSNLSARAPALAYHLETTDGDIVRVVWEGATEHTAAALLATDGPGPERTAVGDATAVLTQILADGPRPVKEVQPEAAEAGIKERTLDRAKQRLGVKATKDGFEGGWYWYLPSKGANAPEGCQPQKLGTLRESWHPSGDVTLPSDQIGATKGASDIWHVGCVDCGAELPRGLWYRCADCLAAGNRRPAGIH